MTSAMSNLVAGTDAAVDDKVWYPGVPSLWGGPGGNGLTVANGSPSQPDSSNKPTAWIQKHTDWNDTPVSHWTSGLLVETVMTGGRSVPNSIVGNVVMEGGLGSGVGVHGRAIANGETGNSQWISIITGMWAAVVTPREQPRWSNYAGLEINCFNRWGSTTKLPNLQPTAITGLLVYNYSADPDTGAQDNVARPNHFGILLGGNVLGRSFHTGLLVDGIINEGIRFEGQTKVGDPQKAGIVFNDRSLTTGIRFTQACSSPSGSAHNGTGIDLGNNKMHFGDSYASQWEIGDVWKHHDSMYFRVGNGGAPLNAEVVFSRGVTPTSNVGATHLVTVWLNGKLYNLLARPY